MLTKHFSWASLSKFNILRTSYVSHASKQWFS